MWPPLWPSYCQRVGLDRRDLAVEVSYDKVEEPTRLVDLKVTIRLPHAVCGDREAAIAPVARHCPVHETIAALTQVQFQILDRAKQAA